MRPPTPLQNSYSSSDEEQGNFEVEDQVWTAEDRTIIAKTKQCLEDRKKHKGGYWRIGNSAGPRRHGGGFGNNPGRSKVRKGRAIFETFSTDGPSEFVVVSRSRWGKHQRKWNTPWRQSSFASASERQWQEGLEGQRVG